MDNRTEVIYPARHWVVSDHPEPLEGTLHHWLLAPRRPSMHGLVGLDAPTQAEFWHVLAWLREKFRLTYLCLGSLSWEGGAVEVLCADGQPEGGVRFIMDFSEATKGNQR